MSDQQEPLDHQAAVERGNAELDRAAHQTWPPGTNVTKARDFGCCPYYLDAPIMLAELDGIKQPTKVCQRKPVSVFNDPLCRACPIRMECCSFYASLNQPGHVVYRYCPIDGKSLAVP